MKRLTIIFLFISPLFLGSQEIYDLKRCIEIGLENNYDLRIVRNEQVIADNNMTLGNAGYLPSVSLDAGYSGSITDREQKARENGVTTKDNGVHDQTLNAGLNMNWTIFDGLNVQTNYQRLKELQRMGELNTRLAIENFIANVSTEYYNYLQQSLRLKNLKSAVKLSRERLRIVEARYTIGSLSRLDLQQAKVDFNADSSKLIKQYEVLFSSRTRLNQMMSVDNIEQPLHISDTIIEYNSLLAKNDLWQKTIALNPYLLVSQREINLSLLDLKQAQSQNYPYLRLNAGYGYTNNMYEIGSNDWQKRLGFNYGLTLGFTIFDGFNRKRQQRNAKMAIQNKELQFQQLRQSLETDFANAWMAYENNIELTSLEKENVATARDNYEIAIERYKLGDLSGIELREAQNSLLEAEERLVQAQYSTKLCEISLAQISGQIISYSE